MSTYNTAVCTLQCPRCLRSVEVQVSIYVGDTSCMSDIHVGEIYPFHLRRQPQNGGPIEGVDKDAGYTECPSCGRDFFCEVEFRDLHLVAIRPSRSVPPYGPDRVAEKFPCPRCGGHQTRHFEFDNIEVGQFLCDSDECNFGAVTVWDSERGVYRADGAEFPRVNE